MCACTCVCAHAWLCIPVHICPACLYTWYKINVEIRGQLQRLGSPSTMWILRSELRFPVLAANLSTCWAVSLLPRISEWRNCSWVVFLCVVRKEVRKTESLKVRLSHQTTFQWRQSCRGESWSLEFNTRALKQKARGSVCTSHWNSSALEAGSTDKEPFQRCMLCPGSAQNPWHAHLLFMDADN